MKVLHLSTHDISGGAARAAYRLHTGLRGLGHDSSMLVAQRRSQDPAVMAFESPTDLPASLRRRLRREWINCDFRRYRMSRPAGCDVFSDDRSEYGGTLLSELPQCDVINLHWIARFVDYRCFLGQASRHAPIVWTLHDMNPFTGGCHYDQGCGRYTDRCGACPQLGSSNVRDLSRRIWKRKKRAFNEVEPDRLHIIAPSRWMAKAVGGGSLLGNRSVTVIPHGLDIHVFSPRDRCIGRSALEIPQNARVVLFAAASVTNQRKGFPLLTQALAGLRDLPNLFLVSLGSGMPTIETKIPHVHLGHVNNDRLLSLAYSAADLFVIPSTQEAFGQTALESIACGTPVVGFAVGGIPDIVRPGVTGLLAPAQDVGALSTAIRQLLEDPATRARMTASCRRVAVEEYALEKQAQAYVDLYTRIVDNHSRRARAV